jgi:SAM-dependent methyltransferase
MNEFLSRITRKARNLISKARHPFDEKERTYFYENPWAMERPSETYRFVETNRIIQERVGPVKTILEIGSGEGHQTQWLAKLGKVHGIEASKIATKRARKRVSEATFEVGELPAIPSRKADLVCAFEVLYYLSDEEVPKAIEVLTKTAAHRIASYHQHRKTMAKLDPIILSIPGARSEVIKFGEESWTVVWW